jgi:hypothetical protein
MGPHLLCFMVFERAGVSLFLGDAYRRQHVQDGFAFNFQFPCQIVDSNLTHSPSCSSDRSVTRSLSTSRDQQLILSYSSAMTRCVLQALLRPPHLQEPLR